ncbi:MAG: RidA family protein [Acidobacteriota bacterium]
MSEKLQGVATADAPRAIGPYSQALIAGDLVFVSGQVPLDAATGEMVSGPFTNRVRQVLANVEAVLRAAGSSRDRVVKATVFLTDMGHFVELNEVYAEFFGEHRPARSAVQVTALPRGAEVEIEVVAVR